MFRTPSVVLETVISAFFPLRRAVREMLPPSGDYLRALSSRMEIIC